MSSSKRLLFASSLAGLLAACGPMLVEPELTLSASPRTIDGIAQRATVKVVGVDDKGKPGTGTVRVTSATGSLKEGVEVDLAAGEATVEFTCARVTEVDCTGTVRITAEWSVSGKLVTATTSITIAAVPMDAGTDAGFDAGMMADGGVDAGMDAGASIVVLTAAKPTLIAGTGDLTTVTANFTSGGAPVVGTSVTFTTTLGSFAPGAGTTQTTAMTNANGDAVVSLHASTSAAGTATVTATVGAVSAMTNVTLANVANLAFISGPPTATYLVVRNAGSAAIGTTMTTLIWKVTDSAGMGVADVDITFAVTPGSAAGATVTPQGRTNSMGNVSVTLASGDASGTVTVRATVLVTAGTASEISVAHPGTPVIYGVPSDSNFLFSCSRKNLGALHVTPAAPPTRNNVGTPCTVQVQDRNATPIPGTIPVQFLQEAGSFVPSPGAVVMGTTTVQYSAFSNSLPLNVPPLPGEPVSGSNNPRDMLVTLIAIVAGEEQFFDGSGTSAGITNGRWDPGEWFVDLAEPFVDKNDNGTWDTGETFFDTEPKNQRWDSPNGVWDSNTQIFRTTHVLWTGPNTGSIEFSSAPPFVVGAAPLITGFTWGDEYLNPVAPDGASVVATLVGTTKGTVAISASAWQLDTLAVPITTEPPLEVTETAAGSGVFVVNGDCDESRPAPGPLTRCIRRYRFATTGWQRGGNGTVTFLNATGLGTTGVVRFDSPHAFSGTMSQTFPVTFTTQ